MKAEYELDLELEEELEVLLDFFLLSAGLQSLHYGVMIEGVIVFD